MKQLETGLREISDGTLTRTINPNFKRCDDLVFWSGFDDDGKDGVPSYQDLHKLTKHLSDAYSLPEESLLPRLGICPGLMHFWTDASLFPKKLKKKTDAAIAERCTSFLRYSMAQIAG